LNGRRHSSAVSGDLDVPPTFKVTPETETLLQALLSAINLLVLLATLIVLIFYTRFTYKMQKAVERQAEISNAQIEELIRQRKLSNLPAFVAYLAESSISNRIDLSNIGKGVAFNVKIDDVRVPLDGHPEARIVLPAVAAIRPEERVHPGLAYAGLGDKDEQARASIGPPIENYMNDQIYDLRVRFLDVEGNSYEQMLHMSSGKCEPQPVRSLALTIAT
jgi:hypothetical protein